MFRSISFPGEYVYMSFDLDYMLQETPTYRPELDDIIWQGFFGVNQRQPPQDQWNAFAHDVIEAFQDPVWKPWKDLYGGPDADAPVEAIDTYAGMCDATAAEWCLGNFTMMTSWNGNIFHVTGHLCGEFTGPRWIPRTKASDAELWCFLWSASE